MSQTSPRAWLGVPHFGQSTSLSPYGSATSVWPHVSARLAQVVQALQLAALALPVADRVLDELERRVLAEVADREDRLEHRLQALVLAFGGQAVHLQKALVALPLDLDQVRDLDRRPDFRKVLALAVDVLGKAVHRVNDLESKKSARRASRAAHAVVGRPVRSVGSAVAMRRPTDQPDRRPTLLDFDLRARVFELLLDRRGLVLGHAFLDWLGRALDEVLGFLQSEAGRLRGRP